MKFILLALIPNLLFASGQSNIWTIESFTKSCPSDGRGKSGIIKVEPGSKPTNADQASENIHLTCMVKGLEMRSAWFSSTDRSMKGWLDLHRNHLDHTIFQKEFNSQGNVIKTFYHLKDSQHNPDKPEFLFVFDGKKNLVNGVIRLGRTMYVHTENGITFRDGQKIGIKDLQNDIEKHFKADFGLKTPTPDLHALIESVWIQQNKAMVKASSGTSSSRR